MWRDSIATLTREPDYASTVLFDSTVLIRALLELLPCSRSTPP